MKAFYSFRIKTKITSDISRKKEEYCAPAIKLIIQVFLKGIDMFKDGEDLNTLLLPRHMEEGDGRQLQNDLLAARRYVKSLCSL